ncbi:MAG: tyrosine-protein phosphatase [Planctomycetaceae bacterium]
MSVTHVDQPSGKTENVIEKYGFFRQKSGRGLRVRRLLACGVLIGVVCGLTYFRKDIKYRFVVKRWGTVVPQQIYRSGQISQWLIEEQLKRYKIGTIVDMTGYDKHNPDQVAEVAAAQRLGVKVERNRLKGDGTGDVSSYVSALQAILKCQTAGEPVLVHCHGGSERTGGVVFCYRTLFQGWDPVAARREMMTYGWNSNGDSPLIEYMDQQMPELCRRLVERGVLDAVPRTLPSLRM